MFAVATDWGDAVDAWVAHALRDLTESLFAQIDIDELLDPPPKFGAKVALECLQFMVGRARKTMPDVHGLLVIPLPHAGLVMQTDASSLGDVLASPWTYGPGLEVPGLYLLRPELWQAHEDLEEYRRSLPGSEQIPSGFAAYYRTWRSTTDAANDWEYNRAIYVRTI